MSKKKEQPEPDGWRPRRNMGQRCDPSGNASAHRDAHRMGERPVLPQTAAVLNALPGPGGAQQATFRPPAPHEIHDASRRDLGRRSAGPPMHHPDATLTHRAEGGVPAVHCCTDQIGAHSRTVRIVASTCHRSRWQTHRQHTAYDVRNDHKPAHRRTPSPNSPVPRIVKPPGRRSQAPRRTEPGGGPGARLQVPRSAASGQPRVFLGVF